SVDTWDQSAGATLIEQKLIDWSCEKAKLPSTADGVFTSGGTQSNLMAMLVAREVAVSRYAPNHEVKLQGLPEVASRFRIYCSEVAHFSIQKAAALLGLGYNAVVPVATNNKMQMDMDALNHAIADSKTKGDLPIAVVITAGTTDFGSIDPVEDIAKLAKKKQLWCHVDGAYGGGLLVSEHHRSALNGIEKVDSITIDYHKSFMQPVSCSAFLLSDKRHFSHITLYADYLNPLAEAGNGTPNLVDKSLQTTRRFDALKLWLTLRTMGEAPLGRAFDKVIGLARQTHIVLNDHPDFEVINYPELSALVFRFAPEELKHNPDLLDTLNLHVRQTFLNTGEAMIARTKINGRHYLKFTLLNAQCQLTDVRAVLEQISTIAWQTYKEQK
ncbi:MAG TPA: pyridoxal-dependent decarboxylase, partial [Pseudoalteromonas sp.]|nr:pyridoxal-dependent decarboxylase [Pseudoalteromonas sp.]